jgi:secretory phospholipase A2
VNLADPKVTPYLDESDRCCRLHHDCLAAVSTNCTPSTTEYDSIFRKGKISCVDSENSCEYSICQCDKLMAECLQNFLNTFNGSQFQNVAKERCRG